MVKVPARPGLDPSRVRSDNPSGQPKGPSRVRSVRASARRSSFPRESHPVKSRPARVSACQGFVRSLPRSAKGLFRQGLGPSRVRSVTLPRSAKGRSVKVPARPGLGPSKVRFARASARQGSGPPEPRPAGVPPRESRTPSRSGPPGSRPVKGSFGHPPPVSLRAVPSRSRLIRGSARQRSGPPEPRSAGVPPREGRPTPPRQGPHRTFSPFLPLHVLLLSSTAPAPLTPPTPRPSILRSGAAEPQGPRFDRRGWNRPSQDVERDFGCGAESCRRVGGSVAEASG